MVRSHSGTEPAGVGHSVVGVPAVVRARALAAGAAQWLDDLPELVSRLEREWSIAVGRPYRDPTEAFVAEATLGDGTRATLAACQA